MPNTIIPIVEGHGEVLAVPVLLRRMAVEIFECRIDVKRPIRLPKQKLLKAGELERALDLAIQKGEGPCGILILIDADDDCPSIVGRNLVERAARARADANFQVVLAKAEYESWFLGALESLLQLNQPQPPDFAPQNAEQIRGAKEKLSGLLNMFYSETVDQAALTSRMDLSLARYNCASFDKFCRAVRLLIDAH
jgi:hypothetical protein